jgi:hypothetical protein
MGSNFEGLSVRNLFFEGFVKLFAVKGVGNAWCLQGASDSWVGRNIQRVYHTPAKPRPRAAVRQSVNFINQPALPID